MSRTGIFAFLWVLLFILLPDIRAQDESLTGSFLSGLFDTITSTAEAKDCPGFCVHALATLICDDVLDDVQCPSSMKCCVERAAPNITEDSSESIDNSKYETTAISTTSISTTPSTTTTTTALTTTVPSTTTRNEVVSSTAKDENKNPCAERKGVCVEERVADYCEAILNSSNLCKPKLRCCVSSDTYGDNPPPDIIFPNKTKVNHTKIETRTTPKTTTSTKTTTTSTTPATTPYLVKVNDPTTSKPEFVKQCTGECTNGFFALLACNDIDPNASCPNSEACCISSPEEEESAEEPPPKTTTAYPITKKPGPICPGYCLVDVMTAFCTKPSVLISHTSTCSRGFVCCDNTRVATSTPKPKPQKVHYTTIAPTTTVDPRPDCPGPCIVSYFSVTCFRNAELTDVFKCKKPGLKCCAPKSLIKEALGQKDDGAIKESTTLIPGPSYTVPPVTMPTTTEISKSVMTTQRNKVYSKYVCGVKGTSRRGRVVGGEDGEQGEWCWQVALINSLNQYLCGAALIGTQWVITAAHCITNIVTSGDAIYVRVGDHDLTRKYGSPGAQTLRVETTYIHHNHNSQTLDNDIAMLKLYGQVELKEGVCLVCLPARGVSQAAGKRCTVTGYGYMGEAGPIPLRVREAEIPIVSDAECIRKVNAVTEKIFILPAGSFCAGGEEGNDACQGDGGGPLVCQDDGFYELVGLVSWGFGCGRVDVPGVYVKVSSFIGWINQIIMLQ
ncbi:trypsin-like serine protease domain-containing protein masquerade [Rhynchophorus ferrugineus]|uniref:trypsin-like serine protease domain-containing protein masquerade n=1 Tax=Rhynchophorus ferrugineus TaxID=354439 RepID=UPI003FCC3772